MVVVSRSNTFSNIKTCKPAALVFSSVPVIDLGAAEAEAQVARACEEFGFFKLVNHGVSMEVIRAVEAEAVKFFSLPQSEKDRAGPPNPFGYGNRSIGPNGDVGWVEYLLFTTNPHLAAHKSLKNFRGGVEKYIEEVRRVTCEVAEKIGAGLGMGNAVSRLVGHEQSDSAFRLNHYPACPEAPAWGHHLVGFGEHTDPHILSLVRSNDAAGLQIALRDGSWVTVPPDDHSFFVLVGDSLQVLTNGRFMSVKHRVVANGRKARVSMIYFGGPPLDQRIAPLRRVMEEGEESLYREFTWEEYKDAAYKSRLADHRLRPFQKHPPPPQKLQKNPLLSS